MAKKNSHSDKEGLWSKRFDENSDYAETGLSRSARKKAERGIPPILTTTIIFLVLLIVLPVGAYIWWSSEPAAVSNEPVQTEEKIQVSKNSTSVQPQSSNDVEEKEETDETEETKTQEKAEEDTKVQEETKKETKEDTEPETVTEESKETPSSTADETTTAVETSAEETIEEEPVVSEEPEETSYNTYTVKAGDNLYRIALNHGMTTDELKQLNGITADSVQVGTVLRVE